MHVCVRACPCGFGGKMDKKGAVDKDVRSVPVEFSSGSRITSSNKSCVLTILSCATKMFCCACTMVAACSCTALTTLGWQCPVEVAPMPVRGRGGILQRKFGRGRVSSVVAAGALPPRQWPHACEGGRGQGSTSGSGPSRPQTSPGGTFGQGPCDGAPHDDHVTPWPAHSPGLCPSTSALLPDTDSSSPRPCIELGPLALLTTVGGCCTGGYSGRTATYRTSCRGISGRRWSTPTSPAPSL